MTETVMTLDDYDKLLDEIATVRAKAKKDLADADVAMKLIERLADAARAKLKQRSVIKGIVGDS